MKAFSTLYIQLEQVNKPEEKILLWKDYLDQSKDPDKLWAIALFSGKRPRRIITQSTLQKWATQVAAFPKWLVEASHSVVGDKNETMALLVPNPVEPSNRNLSDWLQLLYQLAEKTEAEKKEKVLAYWEEMLPLERFIFNKLLTGGFRTVVPQAILSKAISLHTGLKTSVISNRLLGDWTPQNTTFQELFFAKDQGDVLSKPYPFQLGVNLENTPIALGDQKNWVAEWKWECLRVQAIKRGGEWFLWSRRGDMITDKLPEFGILKKEIPEGTVIDCALVSKKGEKNLPIEMLEARMRRKAITKKTLTETPAHLIGLDLLEWEGVDIRNIPLEERQRLLLNLVTKINRPQHLSTSEIIQFDSWKALEELHEFSRNTHYSGLMLKRLDAPYQEGRNDENWWKWRAHPLKVKAVLIYVQRGANGWNGPYSEFTFAVWDRDALVPFAKATPELSESEMQEIDAFAKNNILERFGPVRSIKPELVFEVEFEGVSSSSRHKSGVKVRRPTVTNWLKEAKPESAGTLADLHQLLVKHR